jgi:hypothetical protein
VAGREQLEFGSRHGGAGSGCSPVRRGVRDRYSREIRWRWRRSAGRRRGSGRGPGCSWRPASRAGPWRGLALRRAEALGEGPGWWQSLTWSGTPTGPGPWLARGALLPDGRSKGQAVYQGRGGCEVGGLPDLVPGVLLRVLLYDPARFWGGLAAAAGVGDKGLPPGVRPVIARPGRGAVGEGLGPGPVFVVVATAAARAAAACSWHTCGTPGGGPPRRARPGYDRCDIVAGPLNYMGVDPKGSCRIPAAQQVARSAAGAWPSGRGQVLTGGTGPRPSGCCRGQVLERPRRRCDWTRRPVAVRVRAPRSWPLEKIR